MDNKQKQQIEEAKAEITEEAPLSAAAPNPAPNLSVLSVEVKRRSWFWPVLILLNFLIIGGASVVYALAQKWAQQGSGSEFLILFFWPLFLAVPILILTDIIAIIIYLFKRKPTGWRLVASLSALLVLILMVGLGLSKDHSRDNLSSERAIELINECKVSSVYGPPYYESLGRQSSKIEIHILGENGRVKDYLKTDTRHWPEIQAAVKRNAKKCPSMDVSGVTRKIQ